MNGETFPSNARRRVRPGPSHLHHRIRRSMEECVGRAFPPIAYFDPPVSVVSAEFCSAFLRPGTEQIRHLRRQGLHAERLGQVRDSRPLSIAAGVGAEVRIIGVA